MNNNVAQPVQKKTNGLCIAGLICAILVPLVGLILSIVGLVQAKKKSEDGKGLAIAGIIVGAIGTIFTLIIIAFIAFSFVVVDNVNDNIILQTACSSTDAEGNYGRKGDDVYCRDFVCYTTINGKRESKHCSVIGVD